MLKLLTQPHIMHQKQRFELTPVKPVWLLIHLACRRDWVSREELADLFRPDADEATARHNLRLLLNRAKSLPWLEGLEAKPTRVRWLVDTDVEGFRLALGKSDWSEAVRLYQHPFLHGWPSSGVSSLEAWLELEREDLAKAWREALLNQATQLRQSSQHEEARDLLKRLYQDDPLAEDVLQRYVESCYLTGKRDEALQVYKLFERHLKEELDLEPLPETLKLIGQIREARPLSLEGQAAAQTRVPLQVMRPPQLVGRTAEVAALQQSKSNVVLVAGEAGVGKSRLLSECLPEARLLKCREGLQNIPYFPLTDVMQKHAGVLPDLGDYNEDLARLLPSLFPNLKPVLTDPQTAKARLLEALALYFERLSTPLVFDDLQWADAATLEWLVFMAARARVRLYGTYRSNEVSETLASTFSGLRSGGWLETISLGPLGAQAVSGLLAHLSNVPEGPPLFSTWLFELSAGNPFYLLETLKSLFESGQLWVEDGRWHSHLDDVTKDYSELEIPSAVAELIMRRLKRLPEAAQRALEVASVIREGIGPSQIATIAGLSEWAAAGALASAEEAGLLKENNFAHDLVRQTLYQKLPSSHRKFLHKKVAEALEGNSAPLVVAEHYFEAGEVEKAAEHWLTAAASYENSGLFQEAMVLLERILHVAPATIMAARARAFLAEHYRLGVQPEKAQKLVSEVLQNSQDTWARAYAYLVQAELYINKGLLAEADEAARQAAKLSKHHDDNELKFGAGMLQAIVAQNRGDFETALELSLDLLEQQRQRGSDHKLAVLLTRVGSSYSCVGRYEEALACYLESLELSKEMRAKRQQVLCVSNMMSVYLYMNREQEGLMLAKEALTWGEFDASYTLRYYLSRAYLKAQRFDDALREADTVQHNFNSSRFRCGALLSMAEAYHFLGNEKEKETAFDKAIAVAEASDVPQTRSWAIISVLIYGSDEQKKRVQPLLESLDLKTLPYYLLADVKEVLGLET
jgi:tetratricopeptide (TPR) repeat protein